MTGAPEVAALVGIQQYSTYCYIIMISLGIPDYGSLVVLSEVHFYMGALYTEVSSIQRCPPFIRQGCPLYGGVLYTEVPFKQRCPLYRGVLHSLDRGVLYTEVSFIQRCPLYRGALYTEVFFIQRCPLYRGALYTEVPFIPRCPLYRGALYTEVSCIQRYIYICYSKCPLSEVPLCINPLLMYLE